MGIYDVFRWICDRIFASWWPLQQQQKIRKTMEICDQGHETAVPQDLTKNFYTVGYWSKTEQKWIIGTPFTTRLYLCAGCKTFVPSS